MSLGREGQARGGRDASTGAPHQIYINPDSLPKWLWRVVATRDDLRQFVTNRDTTTDSGRKSPDTVARLSVSEDPK